MYMNITSDPPASQIYSTLATIYTLYLQVTTICLCQIISDETGSDFPGIGLVGYSQFFAGTIRTLNICSGGWVIQIFGYFCALF